MLFGLDMLTLARGQVTMGLASPQLIYLLLNPRTIVMQMLQTTHSKGQYSIQLASKISGVGVHTIRAWEKRYQAVVPSRNPSGRREYNDCDIERLSLLSELCTLGHSIGKIAHLSMSELKVQLEKLGKQSEGGAVSHEVARHSLKVASSGAVNLKQSLVNLFKALEDYKLDEISEEFKRLKLVLNPRELTLKIISPLLEQLERGVLEGKFNISQEHALAALIKFHTGHILFRGNNLKSSRPHRVILCSPEGSFNEFGILQAALLCSFYNLQFYYIGPNLPVDSLLDSYRSLDGTLIIMETRDDAGNLSPLFMRTYAQKVADSIGSGKLIMDNSSTLRREDTQYLSSHRNISIIDDIHLLDSYLKGL